jgi:hypothetical protein
MSDKRATIACTRRVYSSDGSTMISTVPLPVVLEERVTTPLFSTVTNPDAELDVFPDVPDDDDDTEIETRDPNEPDPGEPDPDTPGPNELVDRPLIRGTWTETEPLAPELADERTITDRPDDDDDDDELLVAAPAFDGTNATNEAASTPVDTAAARLRDRSDTRCCCM